MVLAVVIVALVVGLALVILGRRGRRTDDHPLCRRCRFDLTGRPDGAERQCPECGADLARPRAVVVGHRRRRPVVLAVGLLLFVPVFTLEAASVYRLSSKTYWYPYAPVIFLAHEASRVDAGRSEPALAELLRRSKSGTLSEGDCRRAADAGLAYQADRSKPWDPAWGDLLEGLRTTGRLPDDQWARYAAQAVPVLTVRARRLVRSGDPLPFVCDLDLRRVADHTALWVDVRETSRTCSIDPAVGGPAVPVNAHRSRIDAADLLPFRPDGSVRQLVYSTDVEVGDRASGSHALATGRLVASTPFTIGPADRPSVASIPNPTLATTVRQSLTVSARWDDHPYRGRPAVEVAVDSERTPFDVSFDVLVRSAGHEYRIGDFHHGRDFLGVHLTLRCPPSVDRTRPVDVIFRSDPEPAAAATVDVSAIWAGDVTFVDVPVN